MIPIASPEYIQPTNEIMMNHDCIIWIHLMHVFFVIFFSRKDQTKQTILQNSTEVI